MPGLVKELAAIFKKESGDFPPSVTWNRDKWEQMMDWEEFIN